MARRRSSLPSAIRDELPVRANTGIGLDPEFPTRVATGICRAAQAKTHNPSQDMLGFVRNVMSYLNDNEATQLRVVQDFYNLGQPGSLWVVWSEGPSAADVATEFAVSTSECGTPRLPAWLLLRKDEDFDLRWWQTAF